jgi:four helix bundle protein
MTQLFQFEKFSPKQSVRRAAVRLLQYSWGFRKKGDKELIQFLHIALGSVAELETQYLIAVRLHFSVNDEAIEVVNKKLRKLLGFRNYIDGKK